ncbi:amino acid adenylation domain-containing protein [Kitasatospora sp. NPDC096140]|uniref:amino acid adenylation domain-containing protein n=1 Tax=Kitasatospora sp. NPDC096140 TaxID=3155425 RepID=UPI0033278F40
MHRGVDLTGPHGRLSYWKDRLAGAPPALELVTDHVRPAVRRAAADAIPFALGAGPAGRLADLGREHGVSSFTVLVAALQLVLGRYAGATDVSLGTLAPDAGLVVLRTSWEDAPAFADLLTRVQEAVSGACEHGDVPFEEVVAALAPPRDPSRAPLVQVAVAKGEAVPLAFAPASEEPSHAAVLDLSVTWEERARETGELCGSVEYDTELFDRATVERLAGHYLTLLESALADPGARVTDLGHTTPEELALAAAWGTEGGEARIGNLVDAFRAQAARTPDSTALVFPDGAYTYAELLARSEYLAHALVERGITPETVVGLAMDRSAALVVAMLAVLTAGAVYLPLDPGHPEARLAFMVADSQACLVLADRELGFAGDVPLVRIEELTQRSGPAVGPFPGIHRDQRACVLYTSGSTGRPKGVETTHAGIVRLVHGAAYLGFGPEDVVAQAANVSFDAASLEIWGALLNGARLVGIRKEEVLSPELLRARIEEHGVTAMFLTTSVFHQCADVSPATLASLRTVFFGGEEADARRVASVRQVAPDLRLVNGYGPTEGTTFASTFDPVDQQPDAARVPIGRPIAETRLYVLDASGRETGIGVPGELYLAGTGLARGYTGRPDLTAERFVPSPFGVGERLYRTGDLARWREDGLLECLGRADTQVKIRGVRIEPEEIASVLGTCPGVRAAVVDVQGEAGDRRLVAYVVPEPGQPPFVASKLRAFLATRMPEAMVPAWYVALPELPLTPNGKVDRRALPAPTGADGVQAENHVPPTGPTEELVAQVWAELLGVSNISAHDDFLALGGHSLLATQAMARVSARLGVELGVRDLFEAPTVAALAARVAHARRAGAAVPVVPAGPGPHPLSFAQQRLWFLDRLATGSPLYNVPLVLAVEGALDEQALTESVRALVRRQASLRTRLVGDGDTARQVIDDDPDVRLTTVDLTHLSEAERAAEVEAQALREAEYPFDLATGPLVRFVLLKLAPSRHELLLTMHHAISDGWSVGVLVRDLGAFYAAAVRGEHPALPALPAQYPDYAAWQQRLLDGGARDEQLGYWKERLHGAPPVLELPTDRPRPPVPRYRGEVFPVRLSPELTRRLGEVSREHGVTRFMTLLAAFQLALGRYAGVRDVSVGSPVSGRTRPEFEGLVGFFVNTLVLRSRWEDDPTFAELLARVRETTIGAYDHQDVPFEQVVAELKPPRDPSRTPLFQVMLAMQNIPGGTTVLPGLSVAARESVSRVAKFDLTVVWEEASFDADELRGSVEYDTDLFDRATAERMTRHYLTLLESALADPGGRVSGLTMTSPEEAGVTAGGRAAPVAPATTLDGLVTAAARRHPDRPAILQGGRTLTYAELEARADAVCAHLRARGVRTGDTVVVRMPRVPEWPVTLLGVLKAGAAYVPVDVGAPRERFEYVVGDSGAVLVLGSRTDGPPAGGGVPWAAVEDALESPAAEVVPVHPAALAYVLYTSGTTGRPKGVGVSHANLVHTLTAVGEQYGLGPDDRVLQFAALTFDVAAEELFASLVRGAGVVLLPPGPVPGIDELMELVRAERLSVLNLPASYWHEWVSMLDRHPVSACPALRLVVVGSERVDGAKLADWQAATPDRVRWLNAYGPTEATVTATVHAPTKAAPPGSAIGATVPIGRPLPGVRAYVLDDALNPVPPGAAGELYVAGGGVARGYLGDPARTAQSFLPDPWGGPGERMYATRDRARRMADGVLEFLGRTDDQVKLRGFRIELGEIEAALGSHPAVREAVVVLREDTPGRPQLAGYVALAGQASSADLRAHAEEWLPGYMVPAAIVVLDELPRSERGKLDRRALPAPGRPAGAAAARLLPTGELEVEVAAIWRWILEVEDIGAEENFFEAGGHSLLMVRMQNRLSEVLGRNVPVVDLFRFPTVRSLARYLAAGDTSTAGARGRSRAEARKTLQGARAPRRRAGGPTTLETKNDD